MYIIIGCVVAIIVGRNLPVTFTQRCMRGERREEGGGGGGGWTGKSSVSLPDMASCLIFYNHYIILVPVY
jgi:hypothetical protein